MAENTAQKQRKTGFPKGVSGNPKGRPRGALNKTTMAVRELLDGEAEALTRRAVELALEGDVTALRICLDRVSPVPKDRPVAFTMPENLCNAETLPRITASILQSVATGEITPSEAERLSSVVAAHGRALELNDLEMRVARLETAYENTDTAR